MPSVRSPVGLTVRTLGVLLVLAAVVVCALWGMNVWNSAALQEIKAQTDFSDALPPDGPRMVIPSQGLRPAAGSSGDIAVRVQRRPGSGWQVTTRYRLRLRASDPLVETLRSQPDIIGAVIDVLPGGYATAKETAFREGAIPPDRATPNWCTLSQSAKDSHVVVAAEYVDRIDRSDYLAGFYLNYDLGYKVYDNDRNGGVLARLPGQWSWSLEAPRPWRLRVEGRPETQTAHAVRFELSQRWVRARVSIASPNPQDVVGSDSSALRGFKALFSVLGVLAATGGALMGFVRTGVPASSRRRGVWTVSLSFTFLSCAALATAAWDVYHASWAELSWLFAPGSYSGFNPETLSSAIELKIQGALLGTLLFALPSVAVSAVYALHTNRPPPAGRVLMVTAPGPAFVCTAWSMGGSDWTLPVALCLLTASVAASLMFGAVWLGFGGRAVSGWASALAAAVWAGVASTVALQYVPWEFEPLEPGVPVAFVYRTLLASWPLTFLCLTPWVVALLLLAGPLLPDGNGARRAGRIGLGLLLSVALLPWWSPLRQQLPGVPTTRVLLTHLVGQDPGDVFLTGVGVIAPALQVIWLATVVVVLAHLRSGGTAKGQWHSSARPGCIALLLLAAAAPIVGDPLNWLPHWTTSAALLAAWAGAQLLLPAAREERASRLHAISGADHAQLMHSLARALLFAEGRHRFLTASRATLADTSVEPDKWEQKWGSLRAPTAADAAQETAILRAVALGGSGGHPSWANGLAAAAVSGLLTLPWTAWPAWQGRGYSGIPEAVTVAGGTTVVWLAHGFTYGYLYPWIRGRGPVTKASWLWASMCPVQLLLLWPRLRLPFDQTALTAFLLLAQGAVMTLGLALYWEIRLIHRADLLWGHIRNFRRLSSLATPVSTVLVAAVAAAVTVLATAWTDNLTAPEGPPPSSASSTQPPP
ncbi:hypothetical protein OIE43_00225 [Streptomyces pseudovenezuelae]|uniref:hypothetical protein n=1 Tax=Streptomyces pseudovenezuelae TaxID=67350 RepID=UPI002E2FA5A8|nr:hypothetical protein [Streptomyces pseudovenezuelae]